jgi:hypothetical protein
VPVDEHERSVFELAGKQSIRVTDLGQHAAKRVLLRRRMHPPVTRIRPQVGRAHAPEFFDAIANLHSG